jgi:formiminoglutamase
MTDMSVWTGRTDDAADGDARRWHQVIKPWRPGEPPAVALLGFACDAGIARNHGRAGAAAGPFALRRALANVAWHGGAGELYDAGDVSCEGDRLEAAQSALAQRVAELLGRGNFPLLLGGGHEIAWGSYQGLAAHARKSAARIGVINFDAHFDLRPQLPGDRGSSGTPFRQIASHMAANGQPVCYLCIGIARPANTPALFSVAQQLGVRWIEDVDCQLAALASHADLIREFVASVDLVSVSVCLDVLPAGLAPGVSAPAALGVPPAYLLAALRAVTAATGHGTPGSKLALAEIAELSPGLDPLGVTARLGARVAFELAHTLYMRP